MCGMAFIPSSSTATALAPRRALSALALSATGLVGLVIHEGYSDTAITPIKGDALTIGFGSTQGVKPGDKTTPPQALARALTDIQRFEGALKRCVRVPLHQHEYDAYAGFAYNVGSGAFCQSNLVTKLNSGDYGGACKEILRWTWYQKKNCTAPENQRLCGGLALRREREYQQCTGAVQ